MPKILFSFLLLTIWSQFAYAQNDEPTKVKPTVALHGRIQHDFEFLNKKSTIDSVEDYQLRGTEFRRFYLSASGRIDYNIRYKAEINLAGAKVDYTDVYIQFVNLPVVKGNLTVGSFVEPTGLDMSTSSKYIPMMERAMLGTTQAKRQGVGVMYDNFKILHGLLGVQVAYTFQGKPNNGFKDAHLEEGGNFILRMTSPIYVDRDLNQMVSLGVNYESRKRSKTPKDYTLKFRPDYHMGEKVSVNFLGLKTQADLGFEVAAIFDSFSAQAEFESATYKTVAKDYKVNGFYGLISYFLTRGRRTYKKGSFSRAKSFKNVNFHSREFGEWELLLRYSMLDFSDVVGYDGDFNNKVSSLGMGMSWYWNDHTKLMYNHNFTNFFEDGDNPNLHADLIRLQVDF